MSWGGTLDIPTVATLSLSLCWVQKFYPFESFKRLDRSLITVQTSHRITCKHGAIFFLQVDNKKSTQENRHLYLVIFPRSRIRESFTKINSFLDFKSFMQTANTEMVGFFVLTTKE